MTHQGILIAGGCGVIGQRIAAELAPDYQVIVAGRHLEQAEATAAAIGHGVHSRLIDVTVEASIAAALEDIATVVSCIDQPRRSLLHAAIERGLRYTDITPHLVELGRGAAYEEIGAAARASGARVVLGTGIVPGISIRRKPCLPPMNRSPIASPGACPRGWDSAHFSRLRASSCGRLARRSGGEHGYLCCTRAGISARQWVLHGC